MDDIQVNHSGQAVTAFVITDNAMASASLSHVDDMWYVNRVIVPETLRRHGLGTKLLKAAIERAMEIIPQVVVVTPGGYGTPKKVLDKFYLGAGFKKMKTGLYEWRQA